MLQDAVVQCVCVRSDLHPASIWEGTSEAADPYCAALERKRSRRKGVAFGQSPTGGEHPTLLTTWAHECVCVFVCVIKHLLVQFRGFRATPAFQGRW